MQDVLGIIPARYASTRFPGKSLTEIKGKSMIQRVYEQAQKSGLAEVLVATDDQRILDHVQSFGGKATRSICSGLMKGSSPWMLIINS